MRWPRSNQADLIAFYGTPGPAVERQAVDVVPPFKLYYGDKPIRAVRFHAKAAPALRAVFAKIWDYYGRDQGVINSLGIQHYDGAYNPRYIRGTENTTRIWSNHAYDAAIDLDAAHNGFNTGHGHMPLPVVAAFKSEGFRWGGDYQHRTDPMHFEACDNGSPALSFEAWLQHYGCPLQYEPASHPAHRVEPDVSPRDPAPHVADTQPARIQPEDGPPDEAPKSMATSKIGNAQIAAGSLTAIGAGAQGARSLLETTSETVSQISDVATQTGTIVETTKVVTTAVPDTIWVTIVHALTSPEFIACTVLVVLTVTALTWYWRRQHRQAGI